MPVAMLLEALMLIALYQALSCLVADVFALDLHFLRCDWFHVVVAMHEEGRASVRMCVVAVSVHF